MIKDKRVNRSTIFLLAASLAGAATPASAAEIFGGVYAHDVNTGVTRSGIEPGAEIHLGIRGGRIEPLRAIGGPQPYFFGAVSTQGGVNYAAAGVHWKLGRILYARPGIGIAIHDAPRDATRPDRIDFGSRIVFVPEVAVGYQVNDRFAIEASWVHLSHAQFFSGQNPGMDSLGVRVNYRF
jgi:lipid A 3-O-deacylase